MIENLFFLCGPHGAGKSTLANKIAGAAPDIIVPELYTRSMKLHTDPLERIRLKLCSRALENFEVRELAKQSAKTVLANRCIYDADAYARAYCDVGWINAEEREQLHALARCVFPQDLLRPRAIVLNPPFDTVLARLRTRWLSADKKWNEENESYLRAACASYEQFELNKNILYLRGDESIDRICGWMHEHRLQYA
jgi:deoxyadenosine/deoxycytidine kinase